MDEICTVVEKLSEKNAEIADVLIGSKFWSEIITVFELNLGDVIFDSGTKSIKMTLFVRLHGLE